MVKKPAILGLAIGIPLSLALWILLLLPAHRAVHKEARHLKKSIVHNLGIKPQPKPVDNGASAVSVSD